MMRRHTRPETVADACIEGQPQHLWWSERDEITRPPNPKRRRSANGNATADTRNRSGFLRYNNNQSLFVAPPPEPANPALAALAVIGVDADARPDEIVVAYHAMAKQCHPDLCGGDDTRMIELNQAYATLRRLDRV
jgi:DnaJ-domain-containing protein 1